MRLSQPLGAQSQRSRPLVQQLGGVAVVATLVAKAVAVAVVR